MANNLFSTSPLAALGGAGGGGAIRLDTMDHDSLSPPASSNNTNQPFTLHHNTRLSPSPPSPTLSPTPSTGPGLLGQPGRRRRSARRPSLPSYENDSYPARFIRQVVSILEWIKQKLPEQYQPFFYVGLWFVTAMTITGLVIGFRSKLFELLEAFASYIRGLGPAGPPIIVGALFLVSFPPLIGYSSLVTLSGYVFGFLQGFLVAYSGALLGSVVCFVLCRKRFKARVRRLMAKNQSMKSVVRAVEKRGFKMLLLIRLAPYPFNLMNALFSATHIPFFIYFAATALSLVKLALHVYIGSTLSSLMETPAPPTDGGGNSPTPEQPHQEGGSRALKITVMVFSMLIAVVVGAYVWSVALKEIELMEETRLERRRKRRESLARQHRRQSAGSLTASRGGREYQQQQQQHPMGALGQGQAASSDIFSSAEGRSHHHQGVGRNGHDRMSKADHTAVNEIDLTQAANRSRREHEPEEYFVGGLGGSFDDEDDHDDRGGAEHEALVASAGGPKSRVGHAGQGYYDDHFDGDEEDFEDDDYDSTDDSDFLNDLDDDDDDDDDAADGVRAEDLNAMERGQDDVLDLSAAYESTRPDQPQNGIADFQDDEHSEWFSHPGGQVNERW